MGIAFRTTAQEVTKPKVQATRIYSWRPSNDAAEPTNSSIDGTDIEDSKAEGGKNTLPRLL